MKTIKQTLLTILALVSSASAFAQIAVVDSQAIFEKSKLTKEVQEKMQKLTTDARTKFKKQENILEKKKKDLYAKKGVLSSDIYSRKKEELVAEINIFKQDVTRVGKELNIKNKEEIQEIMVKISKIVEDLSKKEGYDLVVSKNILMYSKEQIEITDRVLKILDASK